jgi:MtN3 and saliva related transmembrane protein
MKFELVTIIGVLTVASSYAIKLIGFPDQIRKIIKSKSIEGLSGPLFLFSFISYVLWTIYGIVKNDWVIIWGQSVGVIVAGIVLYQIMKLKRRKE